MRQEQFERLQALSEKLVEVALHDCNPDHWTGANKMPAELSKEERGDAHWCRKIAAGTLTILSKVQGLIVQSRGEGDGVPPVIPEDQEVDLDREIATAEKEATALLDKVFQATRKAEFDKRTRGKRRP